MGKWNPGKIAVVWVIALISYVFFDDVLALSNEEARRGWFFVVMIAAVITWMWLTKREGGPGGQDSN